MKKVERSRCTASRLVGLAIAVVLASASAAQDVGFEGPSFTGVARSPTESKPESKLWINDGSWWGSLWSVKDQAFQIHRLDRNNHLWVDTGVEIDSRPDSHSDALWDGTKLYVLTHDFSLTGGAPGEPILLLRFGYDASTDTYTLDEDFPVIIGDSSAEAAVLAKDSTGTLWAVWIQELRVHLSHSLGSDLSWSEPAVHPRSTTDVDTDDICSVIHYIDRIGVLWSDQVEDEYFFSFHVDGDPADTWSPVEQPWPGAVDDHIDLAADSTGRLFAALKNASDEIALAVRTSGTWQQFPVSAGADLLSRPIVALDEQDRTVHVIAKVGPVVSGGTINEKTSSLDAIAFGPGAGTVIINDADAANINDPTSTRQNVHGSTGLVVLAQNATTEQYWHYDLPPSPGDKPFLDAPLPGNAGVFNLITVTDATPKRLVLFFVGVQLGTFNLATCPVTLGLGRPVLLLGTARADVNGVATLNAFVPGILAGRTFHFQALVVDSCVPSNVISERF